MGNLCVRVCASACVGGLWRRRRVKMGAGLKEHVEPPAHARHGAPLPPRPAASLGERFFNSCGDVVYPAANVKAMTFVGGWVCLGGGAGEEGVEGGVDGQGWCASTRGMQPGWRWPNSPLPSSPHVPPTVPLLLPPPHSGARDFQQWFDFLGLVKDKRFPPAGSPFQMDFPPESATPGVRQGEGRRGVAGRSGRGGLEGRQGKGAGRITIPLSHHDPLLLPPQRTWCR
jgi:hypothetical protein